MARYAASWISYIKFVNQKDNFTIPRIDSYIDQPRGNTFMSCLDMSSGYIQFQIHRDDRHKTAFLTKYGLFEHVRLSFGLYDSPAFFVFWVFFFQRVMQLILSGLTWSQCLAYFDDVVVLGKNFQDHFNNLKTVLDRFRQNNLKLKPKNALCSRKKSFFLRNL